MADSVGQDVVEKLGSRDLNNDGEIINLAIVGSSRYYDFESFENIIDSWVGINAVSYTHLTLPTKDSV